MLDIVRKIYMMLQMFQQSTNIYNLHVQVEIKNFLSTKVQITISNLLFLCYHSHINFFLR